MNCQVVIRLGEFAKEVFDMVWKKFKSRKVNKHDTITSEVWKTRKFDNLLLRLCNALNKQNLEINKGCFFHVHKNGELQMCTFTTMVKNFPIYIKPSFEEYKWGNISDYITREKDFISYVSDYDKDNYPLQIKVKIKYLLVI